MATDDYTPIPGKFKAMKWDGTNTAAFKAWVQSLTTAHTFADTDWTMRDDGNGGHVLAVDWTPDTYAHLRMQVDTGQWAVFGPYWGDDPTLYWTLTGNSPWQQSMPDADFQRQFGPAA